MSCQAITKKGVRCHNPAVVPEDQPVCCRIAAHIEQTSNIAQTSNETQSTKTGLPIITPSKVITSSTSSTRSPPGVMPLPKPIQRSSSTIGSERKITASEVSEFLEYKQNIVSLLNDLYLKGLETSKGDHIKAIEYLMKRFTPDLYRISKKKLEEGLVTLNRSQNVLIRSLNSPSSPRTTDLISFLKLQAEKTHRLLITLKLLYEGGGSGRGQATNELAGILEEEAENELQKLELLSLADTSGLKEGAEGKKKISTRTAIPLRNK